MEKSSALQYNPLQIAPDHTAQSPRRVDHEAALKSTRFRSMTALFTVVLTAAVIMGGVIAVAIVCYGGGQRAAPVDCQGRTNSQIMDSDVTTDAELRNENGETASEHVTYNSASNTVLIDAPGNFSGNSAATIAIDFHRSLVAVTIHEEHSCLMFALSDDLSTATSDLIRKGKSHSVVDVIADTVDPTIYNLVGEVPAGYMKNSNGPIIRGMCAGLTSYWMESINGEESRALGKRHAQMHDMSKRRTCTYVCATILGVRVCYNRC